jgi:hypothetical protein
MNPLEFHESHRGNHNIEVTFSEIAAAKKLMQNKGKVGYIQSLTDYFRNAKSRHRRQNPIAANQADIVNWVLYDRWFIAAGQALPSKFQFFAVPSGQTITTGVTTYTKSKQDTNLDQVRRLSDPQWFNIVGMGFYFGSATTLADITGFLNTFYSELWVGSKVYVEGPIQCFPSASGIYGLTTQTSVSAYTNGTAHTDNFFDLRLPAGIHLGVDPAGNSIITDGLMGITILQGQNFWVDVKSDSPGGTPMHAAYTTSSSGQGLDVMCYLFGVLSRGVQ